MLQDVSNARLLIVDESESEIQALVEELGGTYRLTVVRDGEAALREVNPVAPDLILLNVFLPDFDGYEVCRRLKADPATRDIPVIFISAPQDAEDESKGLALGAVDYVAKPLRAPIVRARIRTHLTLRKAFVKLEHQNQALREAAELREDVERITRHDIKQPLDNILSIPPLLEAQGDLTETQAMLVSRIRENGYRILDMVNRSFDLYKMEKGVYRLQAQPIDLLPVIRQALDDSKHTVQSKKIESEIHGGSREDRPGSSDGAFMVQGEQLLCYSMLANLIRNAVEASPVHGRIRVDLGREGAMALIRIQNQGAVPESIRDRFFDKYVTAGKENGSGLGTYSARLIAETHQGTIQLDCGSDDTTTVTVFLPRA